MNKPENLPDFLLNIAKERAERSGEDLLNFLNPQYDSVHNPFLFKDAKKATSRILKAIYDREKIAIYADFDADGIPGAVILKELFDKLQYKNYVVYIPHRDKEGYGFHKSAVENLSKQDVTLIITVDVGISGKEATELAKSKGIDVIITDHHESKDAPDAYAVLNPKLKNETYPFKHLSGATVAFKLAQAILAKARENKLEKAKYIKEGWEKWLLDLVAISTIADMMPLVGENRKLVYWGLYVLRLGRRVGIRRFFEKERIPIKLLEETDVAFSLIPKINVASRLSDPYLAFELLSSDEKDKIDKVLIKLKELNTQRQKQSAKISRQAKSKLLAKCEIPKIFVTGDKTWNPALLGLSAGKLAEEFNCAVCLWGQDSSGVYKGSCRSSGNINIAELLDKNKDILLDYGGHEGAGGFSINFDSLLDIEKTFNEAVEFVNTQTDKCETLYDASLTSADINWTFYRQLRMLAPFGMENEAPVFEFVNPQVIQKREFGKHNEHLEIIFKSENSNKHLKAVSFFAKDSFKQKDYIKSIVGQVDKSAFAGKLELRVKILDIV